MIKKKMKQILHDRFIEEPPNPFGWPPTCSMIIYQPERPVTKYEDEEYAKSINRNECRMR